MVKRSPRRLDEFHVFETLGIVAAVIEEPRFAVTRWQLRSAVVAHGRLSDAVGFERDYAWRGGAAVSARDPSQVIKRPILCESSVFPCGAQAANDP